MQEVSTRKENSLRTKIRFGNLRLSLDFQMTYLNRSMHSATVPDSSFESVPDPYQYNCLKSCELMSGAGFSSRVHWSSRLFVTGQLKKKWLKLSRVAVSPSIILQKVQKGETFSSKALRRLFNG